MLITCVFFSLVYFVQKDRVRTSRTKIATPTKNTNQKRKTEPNDSTVLPATASPLSHTTIDESVIELEIPTKTSPESTITVNDYENNNKNAHDSTVNCVKNEENDLYPDENGAMSLPILSKPRSSRSPSVATLVSPTTPIISAMSASSSFSWTRERALEQQIDTLRETLKDTEERLHSLRLQYDNVSQMHRSMRDKNHQIQDEMDRLKIDAQHLHECANILRTELQSARKDRTDALEIQAMLQRELETAREDKRRATEEVESNGRQIMDLQRQCKEMERILARKNPDAMQLLLGKTHFVKSFDKSFFLMISFCNTTNGATFISFKTKIVLPKKVLVQRKPTIKRKWRLDVVNWNNGLHNWKAMPKNKIEKHSLF